jgi:hypothetical protein
MATDIYSHGSPTYDARHDGGAAGTSSTSTYRDPAGTAFLWVTWALAFAFWAFFMMVFFGILEAIAHGGPGSIRGGFDAAGGGFLFMDVIGGIVLLGGAIAWGMARWATRDKRRDALTEAATAELYDSVERAGGDDMVARSPEARRPNERDSYRSI